MVAALFIVLFPFDGYPLHFSHSAALVLITLASWSTGLFPPFLTGLIFFALAAIFNLLPADILFSGFSSTAVWLIISGFVIGAAISTSGLGKKMASMIAPQLTGSYPRMITGLVISAVLLSFIMPSSVGRAVVMIPIGMALANHVGFKKGSNGRLGIATSLAIACNMPGFAILPANIPNMILAGASDNLFNMQFGYMEYLLLHFPVLGVLKTFLIIFLVVKIFPAEINITEKTEEDNDPEQNGNKAMQKKVAILLGLTLIFWMTDSIHGINPAWVGLATAVILLLPKWGVVAPKNFNASVDFATVVFVAAALGLGALVNESGLGTAMGQTFIQLLPEESGETFLNFMSLSIMTTITGLLTTIPGVPTVLTPMAMDFADTTGFSLRSALMIQVLGFSTVIFPYQIGPLIVTMQLSGEPLHKLLKITLPLTLLTVVVLFPLDYLWWGLLGWPK
ncbi:Citrate/succinate antiporter [Oligella ureolytica]|nr:Citrate/succinate antiporter [Oligella ureolytica]